MAEAPVQVGELAVGLVTTVRPLLAQVVVRGQLGVIRGSAAGRASVGDRVKVHVTEVDVGGRFEARLLNV